jgi:hypothetical protein
MVALYKASQINCYQMLAVLMRASVLCNNPYCGSPLMELNFVPSPSPQPENSLSRQTLLTDRKIKLMVSDMLVSPN